MHPELLADSGPPCQTATKNMPKANSKKSAPQALTHFDASGQAHMVDVADKAVTHRVAIATGRIAMQPATLALIASGTSKKGDVLGIARIAAIQGAKRTAELIPLCHPIAITRIAVDLVIDDANDDASSVTCIATVECTGRTGVEMEALTAVQIGLLTIYDMCKAVDRGMTITDVRLLEKRGGKSGRWSVDPQRANPLDEEDDRRKPDGSQRRDLDRG